MKCLPGTLGNCLNPQPPGVNAGQPSQPPPPSLASSASSADPMTPASTSTAQLWPHIANWSSIFSSRSSTLHHVPKGARDAWAGLVYDVFSNINRDPSVTEGWLKLFMLLRCTLANPTNGARQPWRETLKVVRARIGRWQSGDISGLWSDLMAAENINQHHRGPKKPLHPDALCASNVRQAKRAIEVGQYQKGIQALTSDGLAPASLDILDEMLTKHPQSPPPSLPSHLLLPLRPSLSTMQSSLKLCGLFQEIFPLVRHFSEQTISRRLYSSPLQTVVTGLSVQSR